MQHFTEIFRTSIIALEGMPQLIEFQFRPIDKLVVYIRNPKHYAAVDAVARAERDDEAHQ